MKMTKAQYEQMEKNLRATGATMYGETIVLFPDELLSKEDCELKQHVLRCQKLQKEAQAKQHAQTMKSFYKFLGWA